MYRKFLIVLILGFTFGSYSQSTFAETTEPAATEAPAKSGPGNSSIPISKGLDSKYDNALTENRIATVVGDNEGSLGETIRAIFVEEVCALADKSPVACTADGAKTVDVRPTDFVKTANIIIGAIAILYLVLVGVRIIFSEGDEEKLTSARKSVGIVVLGLIIIALAQYIAFVVMDPVRGDPLNLDDGGLSGEVYEKVKLFIRVIQLFIGSILLINLTISGYRLIISQGEDEKIAKEKQFLKNFLLGVFMILFAETLIRIFAAMGGKSIPGSDPAASVDAGFWAQIGVIEIVGLINFILGFVAIAAVIMFLLAIVYLLISFGNDESVGRAKTIIINSLIGIFICVMAYALVNFLVADFGGLVPPTT